MNDPGSPANTAMDPSVIVPKSQLDLLANQLATLATSIAEKEQQLAAASSKQATPSRQNTGSPSRPNSTSYGYNSNHSNGYNNNRNRAKSTSYQSNSNSNDNGYYRYNQRSNDFYSGSSHNHTLVPREDIEELMKSLPKYSGHVSESFNWWSSQIDSFLKTFNLRNSDIEYFIPRLLSSRALDLYKSTKRLLQEQRQPQQSKDFVEGESSNPQSQQHRKRNYPVPWSTVKRELCKLDNPISRTLYLYNRMVLLRPTLIEQLEKNRLASSCDTTQPQFSLSSGTGNSSPTDQTKFTLDGSAIDLIITHFRLIETQMECPAPLADRLVLLFQVLPECKTLVLEKINTIYQETATLPFNTIDEVCDFVLIYKDEVIKTHNQSQHHQGSKNSFQRRRGVQGNDSHSEHTESDPGFLSNSTPSSRGRQYGNKQDSDSGTPIKGKQRTAFKSQAPGNESDSNVRAQTRLPKADSSAPASEDRDHSHTLQSTRASYYQPQQQQQQQQQQTSASSSPDQHPQADGNTEPHTSHLALSSSEDDAAGTGIETGADGDGDGDPASGSSATAICNFCGRAGHKANKCFKRKRARQREKSKLFDAIADSTTGEDDAEDDVVTNSNAESDANVVSSSAVAASEATPTPPSAATFTDVSSKEDESAASSLINTPVVSSALLSK